MKEVKIQVNESVYAFYEKLGEPAGRTAEEMMEIMLYRTAQDILGELEKKEAWWKKRKKEAKNSKGKSIDFPTDSNGIRTKEQIK